MVGTKREVKKRVQVSQQTPPIKNKYSWAGLATVFFLSVLIIMSSLDEIPGLTGNAASNLYNIPYQQAGAELLFEAKVGGIELIKTIPKSTVKDTNIKIEQKNLRIADKNVYSKVMISSNEANKFGELELILKLEESRLYQVGINPKDVKIFLDGMAIKTSHTKTVGKYYFYQGTIERMGEIIISKETTKPEVEIALTENEEELEEKENAGKLQENILKEVNPEPVEIVYEDKSMEDNGGKNKRGFFNSIGNFLKKIFK